MTPDQREKQQEHAAEQKAITATVREFGVTRNQARQRLHEVRTQMEQERQRQQAAQPADPGPPPPPTINIETTKFDPRPFTLEGGTAKRSDGGIQGTLLNDVVYLDTSNNSLHVTNIYTDGRDDSI